MAGSGPAPPSPLVRKLQNVSKHLSIVPVAVSIFVLIGWGIGAETLTSGTSDWPSMKILTALGFIFAGVALRLFHVSNRPAFRRLSLASALFTVAIGLLEIVDLAFRWKVQMMDSFPMVKNLLLQMSPAGAAVLLFVGAAICTLHAHKHIITQILAMIVAALALLSLIDLIYDVDLFFRATRYSTMSVYSSICAFALANAILFACPDSGLMRTFSNDTGGTMIRRMLPPILVLPVLFGWLRLQGERRGLFGTEFGVALFAVATIVTFTLLIWMTGRSLNRMADERKEVLAALANSEERLRLALESGHLGMWHYDIATRQVETTTLLQQQLGLVSKGPEPLESFIALIDPSQRSYVMHALADSAENRKDFDVECHITRPDGSPAWVQAKGRPFATKGNQPDFIIGVTMDTTSEKNAETALEAAGQQLANYAGQLERRVTERTAKLDAAMAALQSFVYTIAHDLRAPLRAMSGFAVAVQEDEPQLGADGKEYCRRIQRAAARMDQLISDLLEYGQLANVQPAVRQLNLEREIAQVLHELQAPIAARQAEVRVDTPLPTVAADPELLEHVISKLISNAIKFVPPDVKPKVHLYARRTNGHVRLWVEDNGIGIAQEYHEKIFGIFQRLHTETSYPGTGIGLAIVQKGMEQMGGTFGLESSPGAGSRFWIELPALGPPLRALTGPLQKVNQG